MAQVRKLPENPLIERFSDKLPESCQNPRCEEHLSPPQNPPNHPLSPRQFYFERLGRPRYNPGDNSLRSPGEDLDASGLTEYLWDVLYWTWGCMGAVCVFSDRAWWLWIVVPLYSMWLAYTTFIGVRKGFAGMGMDGNESVPVAESKRQKKLEKRGQRVKYARNLSRALAVCNRIGDLRLII
ncbi:hypothetical protein CISG_05017 [Coccidioides immitis RMSCC 3703]|uniref:Uncharacterized protein n=1 Tax=Coccidioides immitis RMSCC 3703 TaxID=454286 RepID=A0A0J8QSA2_COCIT|nr:hypothetical protein CISG_05017 [Coccidioides immitis RMSCC 3703]